MAEAASCARVVSRQRIEAAPSGEIALQIACSSMITLVGRGDGDGAARAALADNRRHVRHTDFQTGLGRARDGLGLTAFLGADPRIGAGGIDQRDDRDVEAIRHRHKPHRLAIAFGTRHAEIVPEPAVGVGALFVADDADELAAEAAEAADDGGVVAVLAIAGERYELGDQRRDVIEAVRPLRMTRRPASSATASACRRYPQAPRRPWPPCGRFLRRPRSRRPRPPARAVPRLWPRVRPPVFQSRGKSASRNRLVLTTLMTNDELRNTSPSRR